MLFFFPQYKGLFYQLEELWYSKTLQTDKAEYWNTGTLAQGITVFVSETAIKNVYTNVASSQEKMRSKTVSGIPLLKEAFL